MKRWIVECTYLKGNMRARVELHRLGRAVPVEDHGAFVASADHGGSRQEAEGVARRCRMPLGHGRHRLQATWLRRSAPASLLKTCPRLRPSSTAMLCASPRRHFRRGLRSSSLTMAITMLGL